MAAAKATSKYKKKPLDPVKRNIRFPPDIGTYALVDWDSERRTFVAGLIALVTDEAYSGCGLVAVTSKAIKPKTLCRVKVGNLAIMKAEVVWCKKFDDKVVRMGLQYLE